MTGEPQSWLSLKQAAAHLGVHPTTLRRWADEGQVPVLLTPGGHRRFAVADLERFAEEHRRLRQLPGLEQLWGRQALDEARRELVVHRTAPWLAAYDEADRERQRQLGQQLMGILMQYIALAEGGADLLAEARLIGRAHAENTLRLGLPLADALQAMLFFRDSLTETAFNLPETAHVRPEANQRLLRRINAVLNAVELAVAETYDQARR
ncbi:MAG: helix-turn-helix domain-containing protein [Anaerolineales bacterium]|nr:helix-turn-helix domain-containing protein [Anaerolineales bacterium]